MTMRTVTYPTDKYKLVPIEPNDEMQIDGQEALEDCDESGAVYRAMIAAVPDTLPGVIEHSGEPAVYQSRSRPTWDKAGRWEKPWANCSEEEYSYCLKVRVLHDWEYEVRALFTHPAPSQPVERQKLSDPQIRGIAVCDGGGYQDDNDASWSFSDSGLLKFVRAAIEKDRGQA